MERSRDFEELFACFNAHRIRYLVIGAHAVAHYAEPRFTKDLDLWVPPALNDSHRVWIALAKFGMPMKGVTEQDLRHAETILQFGVAPVRIDVVTSVAGVSAVQAWARRSTSRYGRTRIWILGMGDLRRNKRLAGRPQDLLDLQALSRSGRATRPRHRRSVR